jgi:uncharacterized phage protein (TIGR02218 family)
LTGCHHQSAKVPIMKSASLEFVGYLNTLRTQRDAPVLMADCFTFTLLSGLILTYTNADVPIVLNGYTYLANSALVDGLHYKCAIGLDVDQQKITIAARSSDTVGGVPFLQALANGVFDGCEITRERAFLSAWNAAPIGSVILFKGRVGEVTSIGRTSAEVTVNSDLTLLDLNMPRNLYSPACLHVLYDSGCTLVKNAFSANGAVGAGSTDVTINWSGASTVYTQGTLLFSSGANAGKSVTVKQATTSTLTLAYPLLNAPATGDAFTVYQGCDHTMATCKAKFNNLANFRGFPFIPPPTYAF